ncbi:biotin--[acetyl-CoA-carboxylase] ligase [Rhodomicrobium sp. Az07]|uniref:biotin--[acetyl-CoA-carboxylase] ligase n=1 Tax=Rhodomicrobium sp. Az07 TaxID=2839034 RepID=UPI001BE75767|nr:biotin--[acetyl-CoA-carboxylase] ligase [Rhodomicrobium sp. Az07]MBT3070403.1 biotin--[acetyl-CoA-carboxylase] ligase [Rhodomicrobium sp. Az07]
MTLPDIPVLRFDSIDSTNEEALRQLAGGARLPFWIVARTQTKGRGRAGRSWQSPAGNVYATLVLKTGASAATATQLSFVAGLAAYDAAAAHLAPDEASRLRLKWPNDLMLGRAKLAGNLLESISLAEDRSLAVVLGVGMNVAAPPADTGREVASLGLVSSSVEAVFASLARAFDIRLARWDEGRGFPAIREAWLSRALALNEKISVNLNNSIIRGRFCGVDDTGALMLTTEAGVVMTVTAGDIYLDALR